MRSLVAAEDLDHLEVLDLPRLINLYTRYRALPHTLSDDQMALIYASLCTARFTQLRAGVAAAMKEPKTLAREDVTYYRMARAALARWGRASVTSLCESLIILADCRGNILHDGICSDTWWSERACRGT